MKVGERTRENEGDKRAKAGREREEGRGQKRPRGKDNEGQTGPKLLLLLSGERQSDVELDGP